MRGAETRPQRPESEGEVPPPLLLPPGTPPGLPPHRHRHRRGGSGTRPCGVCESAESEESAAKVREVRNPLPVLESRQTTLRYATLRHTRVRKRAVWEAFLRDM